MPKALYLAIALAIAGPGCKETSKPAAPAPAPPPTQPAEAPAPTASPAPAESDSAPKEPRVRAGGVTFAPSPTWRAQRPSSAIREAQFVLPRAEGDPRDAELTVIRAGGTVDANVDRWKGQFEGEPTLDRSTREVGGLDVTMVAMAGTFLYKERPMAPGPGTPIPDTVVLAAIAEAQGGKVFFKAWGPKATMEKHSEAFSEMVASIRPAR